ncbi:MAG: HlyD family type I secretion periplasmic adaptor subunit, partial [Proteobacteria bacterium]|nr:HlyD family type I secretion periplasmic adaptor subunit [Pseudomonadota bacterium]
MQSRFLPAIVELEVRAPSPLPRFVLWSVAILFAALCGWALVGRLDVVAVAEGRLVPATQLRIVQPTEAGVLRELRVAEGERVRAGQVLARMDTSLAGADAVALEAEAAHRRLQLRRIESELQGTPMSRTAEDAAPRWTQVDAQREARVRAHQSALGEERAMVERARRELDAAAATRSKLAASLPLLIEQVQAFEKLAKDGFAGRLMLQQRTRERIEAEQDLAAQDHRVAGARAAIEQSERRLGQTVAAYRAQLRAEAIEADRALSQTRRELEKLRHRAHWAELRAPADGVVKDLATHTPGSVLAQGTVLMTLVPANEPLLAEVWLDNHDAGFVQSGQAVRLKLAGFPFQKYGMLDGKVREVSADASERTPQGAAAARFAYRARVALASQVLDARGTRHALLPGMQLVA